MLSISCVPEVESAMENGKKPPIVLSEYDTASLLSFQT